MLGRGALTSSPSQHEVVFGLNFYARCVSRSIIAVPYIILSETHARGNLIEAVLKLKLLDTIFYLSISMHELIPGLHS